MNVSPATLFTGQQLLWLPACPSTNTEAQQLLRENRASEGCTVITDDQTAGRGQRGNTWLAAPGQNLTLSVVLKPTFLAVAQQFQLSEAVALAAHDWASQLVPAEHLRVKWPNDLYYHAQKLGGILIENTVSGPMIQASIVGMGLNVNQAQFGVPTATSLHQLTGRHYDRAALAARLLECLEARYLQLRAGQFEALHRAYLAALYRYQQWQPYEVAGERVRGRIAGVQADGRLALELAGGEVRHFGIQELRYV